MHFSDVMQHIAKNNLKPVLQSASPPIVEAPSMSTTSVQNVNRPTSSAPRVETPPAAAILNRHLEVTYSDIPLTQAEMECGRNISASKVCVWKRVTDLVDVRRLAMARLIELIYVLQRQACYTSVYTHLNIIGLQYMLTFVR